MARKRHHRCNLCGRDFDEERQLREHVERRHPKDDPHWWVVVETRACSRSNGEARPKKVAVGE